MQCPNCNATLIPNARFCPVCGTSLPAADASVPLPPGSDPDVSISQAATAALESGQTPPPQPPGRGTRPSPDAAPPLAGAHPTQFTPPQRQPQPPQPWSATTQAAPPPQFAQQPFAQQPSAQQPFAQPQMAPFGPQQQPVSTNGSAPRSGSRRIFPGGGIGCLLKIAIVVVVLIIVLSGTWAFALRPSLHSMAVDQVGKMLSSSMD
ncbi:MAG TPA: zinc ribbon domain-containing protein, partial [Ktedonobacteraceae bacterium]|nr:zinc ribbon domain-containing protein [Ktedonobacteraceae bacterium]